MPAELYYRRRRGQMSEINVVPYIDVMLVLLVIFMITAPLLNLGVEVDLPQAEAAPLDEITDPLMITVNRQGDLFLDAGDGPEMIDGEALASQVRAYLNRNPDLQVLVGGDQEVSYQYIYQTMVVLQAAGVPTVGLMGDPPEN